MSQQNFDQNMLIECINQCDADCFVDRIIAYIENNSLTMEEEEFLCQIVENYVKANNKLVNGIKAKLRKLYKQLEQDEIEYNR